MFLFAGESILCNDDALLLQTQLSSKFQETCHDNDTLRLHGGKRAEL